MKQIILTLIFLTLTNTGLATVDKNCDEYTKMLRECKPFKCMHHTKKIGKKRKKIIGKVNDRCKTLEDTDDGKVVLCLLEIDKLDLVAEFLESFGEKNSKLIKKYYQDGSCKVTNK